MSETPVDRQTVIDQHPGEPISPAEADSRESRSRSLAAGGEFLKAVAADLGAVGSRVRLSLAARRRRSQPPPVPTPSGASSESGIGRGLWRVSMVFFGVLLICSGLLSAAMLWVIFGSPLEARHSDPGAPALRAEAASDPSLSRSGTVTAAGPSQPGVGPAAAAPIQPAPSSVGGAEPQKPAEEAKAEPQPGSNQPLPVPPSVGPTAEAPIQPSQSSAGSAVPQKPAEEAKAEPQAGSDQPQPVRPSVASVAAAPVQPGPSSASGAELQKPAEAAKTEPQAGSNQPQLARTETQDRGPAAGQPEIPAKLTDRRPGMQCSVDLCAAAYKSFNAADCTYQPNGGGPRGICELGGKPSATLAQPSHVATDASPKATDTRAAAAVPPIAKSEAPEPTGSQCNRTLCAATYKSFHAADCTYQPEGGGPRSMCELNKAPADAPPQALHAATDSRHSTPEAEDPRRSAPDADNDMPAPGMVQEVAEPGAPDRDEPQCNRSRCAAAYQSFHAADCTYQPGGGGPRRLCEP